MVMGTIYGADQENTFENICNPNYLYNETHIWSDCNICNKNTVKSAAKPFPNNELLDQIQIVLLSPFQYAFHWQRT